MSLPPDKPQTPRIPSSAQKKIVEILTSRADEIIAAYHLAPGTKPTYDLFAKKGKKEKPFLAALFPQVIRGSEIERSLSSKMGYSMQDMGEAISVALGNKSETERTVQGDLTQRQIDYIGDLVAEGRAGNKKLAAPDIKDEMKLIDQLAGHGSSSPLTQKIDLFVESDNEEYYFDLKTPSPNSRQAPDMKKRLLMAKALRLPHQVRGYAVFYYNPRGLDGTYGTGQAYLDYSGGEVLVGKAFWDFLAGPGTYEELLELTRQVGNSRSDQLAKLLG